MGGALPVRRQKAEHPDARLARELVRFRYDPLGYAAFAFPWGERPETSVIPISALEGTRFYERFSHLTHFLDVWACELLDHIGQQMRANRFNPVTDGKPEPAAVIREAVASGHGIGKSHLTALIVSWVLDCWPTSEVTVTAGTGQQLRDKTWANIARWKRIAITSEWWDVSDGGMTCRHKQNPGKWKATGVPWNKERYDAFAGQHAVRAMSVYVFDEASSIHPIIYETAEGGLTDGQPLFILLGNMVRNSGPFYEAVYGRQRHRWNTTIIDSRNAFLPNKRQIAEWLEDYGEDSDFFRRRVRGVAPKQGDKQFIPSDWVREARTRPAVVDEFLDPLVMGIDLARSGSNETVIAFRRGRDARTIPWKIFQERDSMRAVSLITEAYKEVRAMGWHVAAIFADGGGIGGPIIDRLVELGYPVTEIHNEYTAANPDFKNKGAEMWARMKYALREGLAIPDDETLASQLTVREYDHDGKGKLYLESKDDLKDRGEDSPDRADALSLTYAENVHGIHPEGAAAESEGAVTDYDPYA